LKRKPGTGLVGTDRVLFMIFCVALGLALSSVACNIAGVIQANPTMSATAAALPTAASSVIPTPAPASLLTICMGQEPVSLFLYADSSLAARSVRQAIYDGPFDVLGYELTPVILQEIPVLENGGVRFEPITVQTSNIIVDSSGTLNKLSDGVVYQPAGCTDAACAVTYSGQAPVQIDQMVVRFRLRPGLLWSDGAPLTADDSVYSYEVARSLYPQARADLVAHTQSYQALDGVTVEWRGAPGYHPADFAENFFVPLPRHVWGGLQTEELLTAELTNRQPLGWGAYVIKEWTPGDHISLERNPNYFRRSETGDSQGLPYFERLVFRFIPDRVQAVNALLAGECDYLDETLALDPTDAALRELEQSGRIHLAAASGTAWEHLDFGITPFDAQREGAPLPFFQLKETRQAVAQCIDRQRLNAELFPLAEITQVPDSYIPVDHPLFNPNIRRYLFDPQAAGALLEAAGWKDEDNDPTTPRQAQGIPGIPDGTPFEFRFLTTTETEKQHAAEIMQASLAKCGIRMQIDSRPWEEVFAAGPDGPIFGRNFSLAQFGWVTATEPPCFLYATSEIPGPYPAFPKGWGGANVSGYSNPAFDQACQAAQSALPGSPEYVQAQAQAQALFAEDLPALPLYLHLKMVAMRPDLCDVRLEPVADSALWNLESFLISDACP
jgi:peptide/nickel transport system substrate-binding protein